MAKSSAGRRCVVVAVLAGVLGAVFWQHRDERVVAEGAPIAGAAEKVRSPSEAERKIEDGAASERASGASLEPARSGAAMLFRFVQPPNAAELTAALPAPAREVHYVRVDEALLKGKRSPFWQKRGEGWIEIPLPCGGALAVAIEASEMVGPEQFTSVGRVEGRPGSRAVFGVSGRFLHASVEDPVLGSFALRTATEEWAQFYRVDSAMIAGCAGGRVVPRRAAQAGADFAPTVAPEISSLVAAAAGNPQRAVVQVMMVHTQAALPTISGAARTQALESAFLQAIAKVNAAFEASLITARVKLVRVHETQFPGDSVMEPKERWQDEALDALQPDRDGMMDEVHAVRDAVGADVVCLALQRADFFQSGLSYVLSEPGRTDNADYAFSVVQYDRIAGTNVVAHELGHVLGCAHNRERAESPGAFPYSYGYWFIGENRVRYHDIMAYPPGEELGYFSNPDVVVPAPVNAPIGVPAGRPGESDTARTIEQTAFATANYRLQTEAGAGVLVNVATRAFVGRGEQVLIGGFVVGGTRSKRLLVRGAGPALRNFGVSDALHDPVLRVFAGGAVAAENDDWGGDVGEAARLTAAFSFTAGSADAGLVATLTPGAYTAVLEGKNGETGAGLIEVYDVEAGGAERVVNLATRGYADNAGREMHGGFVVSGAPGEMKRILIRVLGPSLARAPFGLSGVLEDPMLQLRNAAGELLLENDDWSSDAEGGASDENDFRPVVKLHREREIFATGHAPGNRREPCVLVDLPPGNYTVVAKPFELRSANVLEDQPAVPGVGIIEVYEIGR